MEEEKIDQKPLAEDISNKIKYEFLDYVLVKPLDPIMVEKEFSKPISNDTPKKDENGVEAVDFENVEKEIKQVESDYRKGIVLKMPLSMQKEYDGKKPTLDFGIGDVIVFRERSAGFFDLLKDSRLVRYYDVIAVER